MGVSSCPLLSLHPQVSSHSCSENQGVGNTLWSSRTPPLSTRSPHAVPNRSKPPHSIDSGMDVSRTPQADYAPPEQSITRRDLREPRGAVPESGPEAAAAQPSIVRRLLAARHRVCPFCMLCPSLSHLPGQSCPSWALGPAHASGQPRRPVLGALSTSIPQST